MLVSIAKYLIKALPDGAAGAITKGVAGWVSRPDVLPFEKEAMKSASRLKYGEDRRKVAWTWGAGPTVMLVHGWGGRAAQMAPIARHVAALGFRSVAIDVTAHGASPGKRARWADFIGDIAGLGRALGEDIYGIVGHSAGALTAMAARRLGRIRAQRYVCICAPSYPFPPIEAIKKRLQPRPRVVERYQEHIARQFETTWDELQHGWAFAGVGAETLLFYDETDRFISHREGDRIKALSSGAELFKTSTYGHRKILAASELSSAIGEFLTRSSSGSCLFRAPSRAHAARGSPA